MGIPCHKGPQGRRTKVSQEAEGAEGKHENKLSLLYGRKLLGGDSPYLAGRETQMSGIVVGDLLYHFQASTKPRRWRDVNFGS